MSRMAALRALDRGAVALLAVCGLIAAGCGTVVPSVVPSPTDRVSPSPVVSNVPATTAPAVTADVTEPSPKAPSPTAPADCTVTIGAPAPAEIEARLFGASSAAGNDGLWVGGLWPNGVLAAEPGFVNADGSVGMKFGWWRIASGRLEITGRRLDGTAPAAIGEVPDGYGDSGFQASGVTFPTEGCWEITGAVGGASLTFVTYVVKVPA